MKVLSFAPYQNWDVHHQVDHTLLRALRLRGAETVMVTCDGTLLAGACYAVTINPTDWLGECRKCGERGCTRGAASADRQITMGASLTPADYDLVDAWMREVVEPSKSFKVSYQNWEIGDWVVGTVHTHLKSLHEESGRFRQMFQRYCRSGLLCAMAMDRILDAEKPDHLVLFGGRDSPYRITYELARSKGIRVLYHERGYVDDSFVLAADETVFDKAFKMTPPVMDWMATPLTHEQCLFARNYFLLREQGRGMNWPGYLGRKTASWTVHERLGIPEDAEICALFTSTPYELEAFLKVPSSDQWLFMDNLIQLFATRKQWLVIRVHPNTAGRTVDGTDLESISRFAEMQRNAPPNVVVIMPDEEFNSYALLHVASIVLAPFSSVAYEGAARGIPSAVMGSWVALACMGRYKDVSVESLSALVDELAATGLGQVETLRRAYRYAYLLTCRVSSRFASFGMRDIHGAEQRYGTDADLAAGKDPTLDRLCAHVMEGAPIYPPLAEVSPEDEEAFLKDEAARLLEERKALTRVRQRAAQMKLGPLVTLFHLGGRQPSTASSCVLEHVELGGESLAELSAAVSKVKTPYVSLIRPGVAHLPRFHETLVDALRQAENPPALGARHGAWVVNAQGLIQYETLSIRTRSGWQECQVWEAWDALALLCLGVFRRDALSAWLASQVGKSAQEFASAAKDLLLSEDLLSPARPMAVLSPAHSL